VTAVAASTGPDPDRQQLRWGPIWAGILTAIGVFVLASLAAVALGLQAAPGIEGQDLGVTASIVTSAITLVAFFIGGFVSSYSANLSEPGRALLNGFLVWSLFLVLVFLLAALGLGSALGEAGELFGRMRIPAAEVDVDATAAIRVLRDASWQSLLALGLTAVSAMLGGVVGAREDVRTWRYRVAGRA
jgi:hypothetical protein